jgi:hypothetical protein
MNKMILMLAFLLLAPVAAFGQPPCCDGQVEIFYSQLFIDDSQADPADHLTETDGVLLINGIGYVDAPSNPYGHGYSTQVVVTVPDGGQYWGYEGVTLPYYDDNGSYTLASTHTIFCPICNCSWTNTSNDIITATKLGFTELYYNNPVPLLVSDGDLPEGYVAWGYTRCSWCEDCECSRFYNRNTIYKCPCGAPPIGLREDYEVSTWNLPLLGEKHYCKFIGPQHPLSFDPCVYPAPWNPECSITSPFPKPLP